MVTILVILAKIPTLGLLKIKVFWNESYDVIIFVNYFTNKILSPDWTYMVNVFIWPKYGKSSISIREVIRISTL